MCIRDSVRSEVRLFLYVEEELRRKLASSNPLAPFIRHDMRPKTVSLKALAGIEDQDVDSLSSKIPCSHSAGRARTDDDDVVYFWLFDYLWRCHVSIDY